MSKRGLTFDEKRERMIELLHETAEFFTLKELEKLASKRKGITPQTVKEVLDGLADDNSICREKIGSSNYYWKFPSQTTVAVKNAERKVDSELLALQTNELQLQQSLQEARIGREEDPVRAAKLAELKEIATAQKALDAELAKYAESDPIRQEETRRAITLARNAAITQTENLSIVISYAKQQFMADAAAIREQFELPEDFEDLENTPEMCAS